LLSPLQFSLLVLSDLEGIIQDGDGNAFLIAEYCTFDCRFVYFYFTENTHFPVWRTLDEFDFSFQVSVSQQTVRDLATLDFIENRENLILLRISAGSGQPFRKHPDAVSELSGQHNGHIRTPCRVGKTFGTL